MLYLRWKETSRRHASRTAIFDGGRGISFRELAEKVEEGPEPEDLAVVRTGGAAFFAGILRGWREGKVVLPMEKGAPPAVLKSSPPAGACLVKYTPGASGVPRAIFFDDARLEADGDRLYHAMGMTPEVPNVAVISLAHSYGFSNVVLPLVLHGVPVILVEAPFPRVVEEACRAHRAVSIPAVPSIWRAWLRAGVLKDLPLKMAISAGAPLSLELERDIFTTAGVKVHNFYGASECGGISFDASAVPRADAGDVGTVLSGVKLDVAANGRLLVESDAVALNYDESRSDDLLEGGRYLTRDVGSVDEDGRVTLSGNTGGAINVSGRKVSPAKVEAALMAGGRLARVRVFGIRSADPERFEEIAAIHELKAGVSLEEMKLAAAGRLEPWEMPRHWHDGSGLWELPVSVLKSRWSKQTK